VEWWSHEVLEYRVFKKKDFNYPGNPARLYSMDCYALAETQNVNVSGFVGFLSALFNL
jgi:hypothetical protein